MSKVGLAYGDCQPYIWQLSVLFCRTRPIAKRHRSARRAEAARFATRRGGAVLESNAPRWINHRRYGEPGKRWNELNPAFERADYA